MKRGKDHRTLAGQTRCRTSWKRTLRRNLALSRDSPFQRADRCQNLEELPDPEKMTQLKSDQPGNLLEEVIRTQRLTTTAAMTTLKNFGQTLGATVGRNSWRMNLVFLMGSLRKRRRQTQNTSSAITPWLKFTWQRRRMKFSLMRLSLNYRRKLPS